MLKQKKNFQIQYNLHHLKTINSHKYFIFRFEPETTTPMTVKNEPILMRESRSENNFVIENKNLSFSLFEGLLFAITGLLIATIFICLTWFVVSLKLKCDKCCKKISKSKQKSKIETQNTTRKIEYETCHNGPHPYFNYLIPNHAMTNLGENINQFMTSKNVTPIRMSTPKNTLPLSKEYENVDDKYYSEVDDSQQIITKAQIHN